MPHKYSDAHLEQKREESRLNRIRRTIYRLLVAIASPGDDKLTEAQVQEAANHLKEVSGRTGQAGHQTTG